MSPMHTPEQIKVCVVSGRRSERCLRLGCGIRQSERTSARCQPERMNGLSFERTVDVPSTAAALHRKESTWTNRNCLRLRHESTTDATGQVGRLQLQVDEIDKVVDSTWACVRLRYRREGNVE